MKRRFVHRFPATLWLATCFPALLFYPAPGPASPPAGEGVHFCAVLDEAQWLREQPVGAGKVSAELNAGEPRTVRMVYFLPNDRPYRQAVVDTMKAIMRRLQTFYAMQMAAHGYGYMTFRYEKEADGEAVVHRVDGDHDDAYYLETLSSPSLENSEVFRVYDRAGHVYFIVIDNSKDRLPYGSGWVRGAAAGFKNRGEANVTGGFGFNLAAHELTHAFGLMWHDFRDNAYVLSYVGSRRKRLSACAARYLAVTPFLNPEIPLERDWTSPTTIEFAGETVWYAPGTERFTVPWRVADPDGIHQVIQWTGNPRSRSLAPEVKACQDVAGETEAVVSFEYDGASPSLSNSSFSYPTVHQLPARTVDTQGNGSYDGRLIIAQASPHHVATLTVETDYILDIAISPGGDLLAVGTLERNGQDRFLRLWDVARREGVASLEGHTSSPKISEFRLRHVDLCLW